METKTKLNPCAELRNVQYLRMEGPQGQMIVQYSRGWVMSKRQCHENSVAFYHTRRCIKPEERFENWFDIFAILRFFKMMPSQYKLYVLISRNWLRHALHFGMREWACAVYVSPFLDFPYTSILPPFQNAARQHFVLPQSGPKFGIQHLKNRRSSTGDWQDVKPVRRPLFRSKQQQQLIWLTTMLFSWHCTFKMYSISKYTVYLKTILDKGRSIQGAQNRTK